MQLADLTRLEQLALAGLIRLLVRSDGVFSDLEVAGMQTLARELGSTTFWTLMREAQQSLPAEENVLALARELERPAVLEWMYGVLMGLAVVDGLHDKEAELLDTLRHVWGLEGD